MIKMREGLKNISVEVQSEGGDNLVGPDAVQPIPNEVLDKHLLDTHPALDYLDTLVSYMQPYWTVNNETLLRNIHGLFTSKWEFEQSMLRAVSQLRVSKSTPDQDLLGKNISIYLAFWCPLSLMLFAHLFHNSPWESKFAVFATGGINLLVLILSSFFMYVYANMAKSPFKYYCQHLCVSSYVGIIAFLYAILCAGSPDILLIPMTVIYVCSSVYIHFNIYNQALKPTLLEMIAILLVITGIYCGSAVAYYHRFSNYWHEPQVTQSHLTRLFSHDLH